MKRILLFIAVLSIMISCKKTSYVAKFDKLPQERVAEQLALVSNALSASPNGWVATLPTQAGGGYGFYISFDKELNVSMYGDMTATSSSVLASSYYRVKQDMGAELVFDTYNYIAMLNDPNASVLGGAAKIGYSSDVEFTFDKIAGDTMVFIGKKFRQPFRLVKATPTQKAAYLAGGLKTNIDKLTAFFVATKNPYIDVTTGATTNKAAVAANFTNNLALGKRIELTALLANNTVTSAKGKFAITTDDMPLLSGGLIFQGITFVKLAWKDANTLAFYDNTGKEYIIKSNPTPLTPLAPLFGFPNTFLYRKISIGTAGLAKGVTSQFNDIFQAMVTKLSTLNPARTIVGVSFTLTNGSTATVNVSPNNGTTTFSANATFNYTISNGVITLTNPIYDGNWTARGTEYDGIKNFFLSGPFKLDWVVSSDPTNTSTLGGLYRVADPTSFFYGTL